jgi:3-deoxy-D-manno-octulosonate 8-phosphate phosphatase (KDO 8-P phosphatase)
MTDDLVEDIELLILDVDGVLTDGSIQIDDHGVETKRFCSADGLGIRLWMSSGAEVAILTGREGNAVRHRAEELGIRYVVQGRMDKRRALGELLDEMDLRASQAAMVGDDLPDLPVMKLVGYPIAVANAVREVQNEATFVTVRRGGEGAVREAVEHLLKAQGRWESTISTFL